jgi:pimeloyl-ACP methyl ester carboxylesterase
MTSLFNFPNLLCLSLATLAVGLGLYLWQKRRRSRETSDSGRRRRGREAQTRAKWGLRQAALYLLRLMGFAMLAFTLVGGSVLLYIDYNEVSKEIAPAPSPVQKPDDLPFEVEEVSFESEDGVRLAGWYTAPRNGAVIILLHGYGGNRLDTRMYAEPLAQAGYGLLMYDERASGESGGERRSYGWEDTPDVGAAIAYLRSREELTDSRLGIAGCSMGGQIALQGAARYPELEAVWADGMGTIRAADLPPVQNWVEGITFLSTWNIDWMMAVRLGIPLPKPMVEIVGEIAPRPAYLVGGGNPRPYFGSEERRITRYAQLAGGNARLWIIAEATHCDGPRQRPEEYRQRLLEFFGEALGK